MNNMKKTVIILSMVCFLLFLGLANVTKTSFEHSDRADKHLNDNKVLIMKNREQKIHIITLKREYFKLKDQLDSCKTK